jgi:hypothetical protein
MIQATGTITLNDGVTQFKDPLININFGSANKHMPTFAIAEIGEEIVHHEKYATVEKYLVPNPEYEIGVWDEGSGIFPEIEMTRPKADVKPIKVFKAKHILLSASYVEPNPTFEGVQNFIKAKLEETYPTVNFQII